MSILNRAFKTIADRKAAAEKEKAEAIQRERDAYAQIFTPVVKDFIQDLKDLKDASDGQFLYDVTEAGYESDDPCVSVSFGVAEQGHSTTLIFDPSGGVSVQSMMKGLTGGGSREKVSEQLLANVLAERLEADFSPEELQRIQERLQGMQHQKREFGGHVFDK